MRYSTIQLGPAVTAALDGLRPPIRESVLKEIEGLIDNPTDRPNTSPGPLDGIFEFTPTADPTLSVLFRIHESEGVVEALDLVRPDVLRAILRGTAGSAGP
jgi:hypothetical protein